MIVARLQAFGHLARRFLGALRAHPPTHGDRGWVRAHLTEGEYRIWSVMSVPDQDHSIQVARAVRDALPSPVDDEVVAAALLHDSGKNVSNLGTLARVAATIFWVVAPVGLMKRREFDHRFSRSSIGQKLIQYRRHPELGADALEQAGSRPLVVAWAREHHRPESAWTVDLSVGRVLKDCDDD